MFKFVLVFVSVIFCSTLVSAQQQDTAKSFFTMQPCDLAEKIFKTIKKYDEKPLFTGRGIQFDTNQQGTPIRSDTVFFVNQDTGTWSLLSVYTDGMVCMIASGKEFEPYTGETQ
mgnify:CR=1 FL=1